MANFLNQLLGSVIETDEQKRKRLQAQTAQVQTQPKRSPSQQLGFVKDVLKVAAPIGLGALNTANLVGSGFNQTEASKRNREFLRTATGNVDNKFTDELAGSIITPEKAGKAIVSGIQQSAGRLGDVALMGGSAIEQGGIDLNPFISEAQKNRKRQQSYRSTENLRDKIKQGKTITGESLNPEKDFEFTGNTGRDISNLAGRGLQTGLDATTFVNPGKALTSGAAKAPVRQIVNQVAKESALYGGLTGAASGASEYGQTGDVAKALQTGATNAVLSGAAQGILGGGGYALGRAGRTTGRTVNQARPSVIASQDPRVLGFDDQYTQLARQFDNLSDPVARRQVSKAMAVNRLQRNAAQRRVQRELGQGGYIRNPLASADEPSPQNPGTNQRTPEYLSQSQKQLVQNPSSAQKLSLPDSQMTSRTPLNTSKYNIDDATRQELNNTVNDLAPQLDKKIGKKLSLDEAQAAADQTTDILRSGKTREQTAKSVAAMQNARQKISEYAQRRANGEQLSPAEQSDFVNLTLNVKSTQADLARQLGSLRNSVDPRTKTLIDVVLEQLAKKGHDIDELTKMAEQFDLNNPSDLAKFYRSFEKATAEDWLDKLRYNSMLSSPLTHSRNVSSSALGATLVSPVQKLTEGGVDAIRAGLTGRGRERYAGEAVEYVKGLIKSGSEAKKAFTDSYKGNTIDTGGADVDQLFNLPLAQGGFKGMMDSVLSFTTKLMEATDQAGLAFVEGGERRALNYRAGKGVNPGNIDEAARKAADYRLFRQDLGNKEQGNVLRALDFIPQQVSKARNTDNPVVRTMAKLTFPFVKTPTNVAKQLIEYSPLGVTTLWRNEDKTAQIAKAIMGTTAVATVAGTLAANDALTFGLPTNPTDREKFLAEGKQPYSFKIGDKWVSYQYLHPAISFNMAAVSSVNEALKNKDIDENTATAIMEGLAGASRFFVDQSYFKNAQDFLGNLTADGFQSPASTAAIYANNVTSQFIPFRAAATWIKNMVDPVQRKVDSSAGVLEQFRQNFAKQLPGLSNTVKDTYTDALGNPLENTDVLINSISPARIKTANPSAAVGDDALSNEINRLYKQDEGIKLSQIGSKVKFNDQEVALDNEQQKQLTENINTATKAMWDKVIADPKYKDLSDEDKRKALSSIKSDVTAGMKDRFAQDYGYGQYAQDYTGKEKKLSKGEKNAISSDPSINRYLKKGSSSGSLDDDTKLDDNSVSYQYLDNLDTDDDGWEKKSVDKKYSNLVDTLNKGLPAGLPPLPQRNDVAKLVAEFDKKRADEGWSDLQAKKEMQKLYSEAYKTELSDNQKFITSLSDTEIGDAVENGQISEDDMKAVLALDDALTTLGFSAILGTKLRSRLGLGSAKGSSGKKGGSKKAKKGFQAPVSGGFKSTSSTAALRKLIGSAGSDIKVRKV